MPDVTPISIRLEPDDASPGKARRFIASVVPVTDASELQLMVSELVSNVVRHVGGPMTLTVRIGDSIRVEVHNHQAAADTFRELVATADLPGASSHGGRGLALVRALATDVGLDDEPNGGKIVWFEYTPRR